MSKHDPVFVEPEAMPGFGSTLESLVVTSAASARPPERLTVSQAAEKYRYINNPGNYVGDYTNDKAPYMVEPQDTLQSQEFDAVCLAASAQSGKTEMFLNWLTHSVKCDPADMLLVQTGQNTARDFSMRRVDRMHKQSPKVGRMLANSKSADNTFDKHYKSGMMLSMSWPSVNELSGKPIPRQFITDLDRMSEDVDGEGDVFTLTAARGTTFRRYRMTGVESSPGFTVEKPNWVRTSPHEAPPTRGILSIYNQGDRRRWQWDCVKCHVKFEPDFSLLDWPDSADFVESAEKAVLVCPHCQHRYNHGQSKNGPGKYEMNLGGRWVKDNMVWTKDGDMVGNAPRSAIASFWLKGASAGFSLWKDLVFEWLSANDTYEKTGSEQALKTTVNTKQGDVYTPKSMSSDRVPETIKATAKPYGYRVVPVAVRFLIATVDVQKNRFIVQVHGIALNGDIYIVDRFEIQKSKRTDKEGERLWCKPGSYLEDWKILVDEVIQKSYPLADGSGRRMSMKLTMCDSGGKAGVTSNAYDFVRWLRMGDPENKPVQEEGDYTWAPGMAGKFQLLKGDPIKSKPRCHISYPDSNRKDRTAGARGEIAVAMLNTNALKDMVDNRLDRTTAGGRYCFPDWLDDNFYIELTVEIKDPTKGWLNPKKYRNESFDLLYYCMGALLTPGIMFEYMKMDDLPGWATGWDTNDLVFDPELQDKAFDTTRKKSNNLANLASNLA